MIGRFFALESGNACDHGPSIGCDKCKWKRLRKQKPVVTITLVAPEAEIEGPEIESYPVVNDFGQVRVMPNSPWS